MCGIAGLVNVQGHRLRHSCDLTAMNALIKHRGPDGEGFWVASARHVGLAHRRLSIIDLSDRPTTDDR